MGDTKGYYDVSELNKKIRSLLDREIGWIKVKGEISSLTPHRTGNFYFTLKDNQGQIDGVVFKNFVKDNLLDLQIGDYIYGVGVLTSYVKTGRISFQAFSLSKQGRGNSFDELQNTKNRLEEEGVFLPQKRLTYPSHLTYLAIVTALHAAALGDILSIVRTRILGHIKILIVPALMQGEGVEPSVLEALESITHISGIQAVLLTRGGGAYEDLWGFNSEKLVRYISNYPLPVISAIGHEQDYTLCDFVAYHRYATPSAAAYNLFAYRETLQRRMDLLKHRLFSTLSTITSRIEWKLHKIKEALPRLLAQCVSRTKSRLDLNEKILFHLSPMRILEKGYIMVTHRNEKTFSPKTPLKLEDVLTIQTLKGKYLTKIIQKSPPRSR